MSDDVDKRDRLEMLLSIMRGRSRKERSEAVVESIEREILQERAAAYGRANDKVREALDAVTELGELLDGSIDGPDRELAMVAFHEQRGKLVRARWELRVHREALGLPWSSELDALYPVPPARR